MKSKFDRLSRFVAIALFAILPALAAAQHDLRVFEAIPDDPCFRGLEPVKAPPPGELLLKPGDRLALVGDSITEQKMYSRLIETYLTVCEPALKISTRQFGWSGETAEGFLRRMENDCLRFQPTVVTLCYGMNDYRYRPYDEANAAWYRDNYSKIVRDFKASGARVVLGSPGCVDQVASWVKSATGTLQEHNQHLCKLRNIGIEIAAQEQVRFADVFWPMYTAGFAARQRYAADYDIAGKDGVHPGWAGHLVMAYAYLQAMGLDGEIGTITINLKDQQATATPGHTVDGFQDGCLRITSGRYPFCAGGELDSDNSLRSGMSLVPFNRRLNRLMLVVNGAEAADYEVIWGEATRTYSAAQLVAGVNLAADFVDNPFSAAFARVDQAVAAKQAYETTQIKKSFHSPEARSHMDAVVAQTEAEREPLAAAIAAAFVPVAHELKVKVVVHPEP